PVILVDGLIGPVLAGDEEDQQRRRGLAGSQGLGEIGHDEDLRFFPLSVGLFAQKVNPGVESGGCVRRRTITIISSSPSPFAAFPPSASARAFQRVTCPRPQPYCVEPRAAGPRRRGGVPRVRWRPQPWVEGAGPPPGRAVQPRGCGVISSLTVAPPPVTKR